MRLARAVTVVAAGAAAVWFLERRRVLVGQRQPALPWPPEPAVEGSPESTVHSPQSAEAEPAVESTVHSPQSAEAEPAVEEPEVEEEPVEEPPVEEPPVEEPPVEEPPVEDEPVVEDEPPAEEQPRPTAVSPFFPSEQPTREQPAVEREGEPEPVDVTAVVDDLISPGRAGEDSIVDAEVVDEEPELSRDERIAQAVRDELARVPGLPAGAVSVEVTDGTVFLRGRIDRPGTISELDTRVRDLDGVARVRNLLHLPGTPPPA